MMPPSVGIVWGVRGEDAGLCLITDMIPLDKLERYGDYLTHPAGHYEV